MNNQKIYAARQKYEEAAKNLCAVVTSVYPPGTDVLVEKGRSTFEAKVISVSDSWWSTPGRMTVRNRKTGKTRHLHYLDVVGRA